MGVIMIGFSYYMGGLIQDLVATSATRNDDKGSICDKIEAKSMIASRIKETKVI